MSDDSAQGTAFAFTGNWREFAPIAITNLLLTIVTLGIYTFWARTRTRQYLWSRTRFIDDRLEWTGTGVELLIGYIMAFFLLIVPLGLLNLLVQGLVLRGDPLLAGALVLVLYLLLLYLVGVATFRALRYRLSRTYWHGIRGGSDAQGLRYGVTHLWRSIVGAVAIGLMVPWSMTTRWNARWSKMGFGTLNFSADANWGPIFSRYLLFYLSPIILLVVGVLLAFLSVGAMSLTGPVGSPPAGPPNTAAIILSFALAYIIFFGVLGLIALIYYAAFYREAIGTLTLGELEFGFTADTGDWVKLALGNIALVIFTLGLGYMFVGYRNWAFFIRHMEAYGEVGLDALTQSTTRAPGQGEGLLDAFDVGAF